jgi:hypothetical protein
MSPISTPCGPKAVDPITALEANIGVVRLSQRQGSGTKVVPLRRRSAERDPRRRHWSRLPGDKGAV